MRKYVVIPVVFVVIIAALLFVGYKRKPMPPDATTQQLWSTHGVPVETAEIISGSMDQLVDVTGDISALTSAILSSKIPGRLTSLNVHEGDYVSKGQTLAVLDRGDALSNVEAARASLESANARVAQTVTNAEVTITQTQTAIDQANANLKSALARLEVVKKPTRNQERMVAENRVNSAKANMDKAKADYNRNERLLNRGAISQSAFDVINTQYIIAQSDYKSAQEQLSMIEAGGRTEDISSAQAQVDVARAQLRDARANASQNKLRSKDIMAAKAAAKQAQAALDTARRALSYTYITAPISGVVASRTAEPGQVVVPGQPLATLVDLGSLYMKAEISEKYLGSIKPNQTASVRVDAVPGKSWQCKVDRIYPSGSTLNRNFEARIPIVGASSELKPGMSASASILTGRSPGVVLVPKDAIAESNGVKSVFIVSSDNTAIRREIVTVRENHNYAQLAEPASIKAGDIVVTQGHKNLSDGDKIEISTERSASNGTY